MIQSREETAAFRQILWLSVGFAALKLAIQIAGNVLSQRAGYGIFRDEMYYLICGRHLAFGYVDQPPLVALQARVTEMLFGFRHMWSLRLISGLAGAATVFLTGMLTWALGGGRKAAALAMLGVTTAGVYLSLDSYLSMNSFDPVFWMLCVLALTRIVRASDERALRNWWLVLGVSAGLATENKASVVFFLVAVLLALLVTPQRRILWNRWCGVAILIIVALGLPNLLWQIHYHFPTLEWLVDVSRSGKDVKLPPGPFLRAQVNQLTPWTIFLWLPGVLWLLVSQRTKEFRFLGALYVIFLAMMLAMHAKDYYLAPVYPVYFSAGAIVWFSWVDARGWARPALWLYTAVLIAGFFVTVPIAMPILPPAQYVAFATRLHYHQSDSEAHEATVLPQFFADRFGWQEMVEKVARIYNSLPPEQRAVTGIYVGNYGEASAINLFGPRYGLPVAISGHQNYWLWGPHGYSGKEMIIINGATLEEMKPYYRYCGIVDQLNHPLAMPWEHSPIFLCYGRNGTFAADWKDFKHYH